MPNQYTPYKRTIGELLSLTNPPIVVPDWQRNYSWSSSEAEILWQDIIDFDSRYPQRNIENQEYFLGSVVIVDNNSSHLLLDGQQRLATAAILLSVIRENLARYNRDAATRVTTRYLADFDDASNQTIFKLTLNIYDRDFFKREILEERHLTYQKPTPQFQSHRLIREVRETFSSHFILKYEQINNPYEFHQWALRILQVLVNHVSVVAIMTLDEDNASAVFETLNDRGIGLSTPDLLRNFLLRRAPEEDREEIITLWALIYEIDDEVKIDTFLRHYWLSKVGDVKTRSLYREIKSFLLSYNQSSLEFTRDLSDSAEVYKTLITALTDDELINKQLKDIRELGANMLYPVLLSASSCNNSDGFLTICKKLVSLYIRYNVIGRLENSPLETFCYTIAKNLRSNCDFITATAQIKEFAPSDDQFRQNFVKASVSRRDSARYILREIEMNRRSTGELEVGPPSRVHVEHIYPQTPIEGEKWPNHSSVLNRLGNLTLLDKRLNSSIKNGVFEVKLPSYSNSEIIITKSITKWNEWSTDIIDKRQAEFVDDALFIWSF